VKRALFGETERDLRVLTGPLRGAKLNLNPAHEARLWAGIYERDVQDLVVRASRPDSVAWDVGAHVGFFTILLARHCRSVLAVEPDPRSLKRLERNVALNQAAVDIVSAAVGPADGSDALDLGEDSRTTRLRQSGYRTEPVGETVEVAVRSLDSLGREHGWPDLLKLDVEGMEGMALASAPDLLQQGPMILCEAHTDAIVEQLTATLRGSGYRVDLHRQRWVIAKHSG